MIRLLASAVFIVLCCVHLTPACAQQRGERVVAIRSSELKADGKVIAILPPGAALLVMDVAGDLLRVSSVRSGWVHRADVAKVAIARDLFRVQIQNQPGSAAAYLGCAGVFQCNYQFDEAIEHYGTAIRLDPKNRQAYSKRGECWLAKGQADKAIADFAQALALNANDPVGLTGRAAVSMQRGNLNDARRDAERAIQLAPDYADAYITRGFIQQHTREFDKAIHDFDKAIELNSSDPNLLMHRGDVWFDSGKYEKAIEDYTGAQRRLPHEIYLRHRARAWWAMGKLSRAIGDLRDAIRRDASDSETLNALAWLLATGTDVTLRDGAKAVEYATKACEATDWKVAEYLDTLAAAYAERGDFGHAVGFAKKSLTLAGKQGGADFEERLKLYQNRTPYRETKVP